jgi:hypothetical protein
MANKTSKKSKAKKRMTQKTKVLKINSRKVATPKRRKAMLKGATSNKAQALAIETSSTATST